MTTEIKRDLNIFESLETNKGYDTKSNYDRDFITLEKQYKMSRADISSIGNLITLGYNYDDTYIVPLYQRDLCWELNQKQNLILSILRGNPIGDFLFKKVFALDATGRRDICKVEWHIIDGQQRVNAIREFFNNVFPINENLYFRDLKYWDARSFINDFSVTALTVQDILLNDEIEIYLQRNCGGTMHTDDELQKARNYLSKIN